MYFASLLIFKNLLIMKSITSLSELLTENMKKLYSSEQQQLAALPTLAEKANSPSLKRNINAYLKTKEENINRLKQSFHLMNIVPRAQKCEIIQGLIQDCQSVISHSAEEHVADAGL